MSAKLPIQQVLYEKYILDTPKKAFVYLTETVISRLSKELVMRIRKEQKLTNSEVRVSTKVLKHIYDDHAVQHETIIRNLHLIISLPDTVYKNKPGKGGEYMFVKEYEDGTYCAILDISRKRNQTVLEIRTCFYVSHPRRYFKNLENIWSLGK